jgi:hypothetical protein
MHFDQLKRREFITLFVIAGDPIAHGLVASLNHPGGTITLLVNQASRVPQNSMEEAQGPA